MADIKAVKTGSNTRDAVGRSGISSPYFDLDSSINVAEIVHKNGGGTCSPEQLAAWLGYKSTASGTYLTRVSAANKHFRFIDSSGDRFTITDLARKILAPVMPEDAASAKVEAFLSVPFFAKVYEQFKGSQLPPEIGLKNLFSTTYKILPDRVPTAVRVFLNSAEQAGFFSTTGDRTRLVRPSVANLAPAPTKPKEEQSAVEKPKFYGGGGGGGDGTAGVHGAIVGLLRDLPQPGTNWNAKDKKRFLEAFKATVEFIYPTEDGDI